MTRRIVAVDLATKRFEVAIAERPGDWPVHKRFSRRQFERFIIAQPASLFVLESCGMAHFWARRVRCMDHKVEILPAHYVAAYRRRNKTDRADTLALLEAARAPDIHPVAVKLAEQQAWQQLHRLREQLIKTRTARINLARAMLREQGFVIAPGAKALCRGIPAHAARLREMLFELLEEIRSLERRALDRRLVAVQARSRVGFNKAVVTLANKLARRAYALCRDQTGYGPTGVRRAPAVMALAPCQ